MGSGGRARRRRSRRPNRSGGTAPTRSGPDVTRPRSARTLAGLSALLALLVAAVYFPVVRHQFVSLDDPTYFEGNPNLDGHLGLDDLVGAFAHPYFANYAPLTSISIAIDDAVYDSPAGTLVTNAMLHAVASILLLLALVRLTRQTAPSFFVAAVFAVHPLHVESVAWASQRKDVLMGVGWTAAMLAYARYREAPGRGRYAALVACSTLALLAKPVAVTLPFALLLLDFWPLGRFGPGLRGLVSQRSAVREAVVEKLPLFGLSVLSSVITVYAQASAGATRVHLPLVYRLANAGLAYAAYLRDTVWPAGLAVYYPYDVHALLGPAALFSWALIALATAGALRLAAAQPWLLVGWLWFLGTLLPMIGLVQVGSQSRADRYMYIPLVGLALAATWTALHVARARRAGRRGLAVAGSVAVVALAGIAGIQVRTWSDSETLYLHALAVTHDNAFVHTALGRVYREEGRLDDAERHFEEAVRIQPSFGEAHINLGLLRLKQGRSEEARREIQRARSLGANAAQVDIGLGLLAERAGDTAGAIARYREALRADPARIEALNNLAWLLATADDEHLRDPPRAIELAEHAARRSPHNTSVLDTLAAAYAASERWRDAVGAQQRAVATLAPGDPHRAPLERHLARYVERLAAAAPSK